MSRPSPPPAAPTRPSDHLGTPSPLSSVTLHLQTPPGQVWTTQTVASLAPWSLPLGMEEPGLGQPMPGAGPWGGGPWGRRRELLWRPGSPPLGPVGPGAPLCGWKYRVGYKAKPDPLLCPQRWVSRTESGAQPPAKGTAPAGRLLREEERGGLPGGGGAAPTHEGLVGL